MNSSTPLTSNALVTRFSIAIPSERPTPASDRQTASFSQDFRQSLSPCDRPFSGSVFRPCDRPSHGPSDRSPSASLSLCDRPAFSQCKTPSLRRGSAKRSACLSTVPSADTFGAIWPNETRYHCRLFRGLLKFAEVLTIHSQRPPEPATLAKRSCVFSIPTPAAGAAS
jgi:hypothetical protein